MNQDSTSAKVRLRERLRDATTSAILEAGEAIFAEQGLRAARMDAIAERAGVAVGTLYNYFADRHALVSAIIESRRAELFQKLDEVLESSESGSFTQGLEAFVSAFFLHVKTNKRFFAILLEAEADELAHAKKKEAVHALLGRCERIVARGREAGVLKSAPYIDYAAMLHGSLRAVLMGPRLSGKALNATPEHARALVDFFLCGAGKSR